MSKLQSLLDKIRSIADEHCESQMYCWPGFDPMDPNPKKFFKKTFSPMSAQKIAEEEREIGVDLPLEYKTILCEFGGVHLPGNANVAIETPLEALRNSRPSSMNLITSCCILATIRPFGLDESPTHLRISYSTT